VTSSIVMELFITTRMFVLETALVYHPVHVNVTMVTMELTARTMIVTLYYSIVR